jgi:tetratricopeptide (TPR) repeat protein
VYNRAITDNNLGGIALNQGRLEEARDFYRAGLGALEQIGGSLWALGGFHSNLGAVYIRMGDPETARRHLEKGRDYFDQAQARDWLPELHRHLAEAARLAGERAEAQAEAETALRLARELSMRGEEGGALRLLGRLAMARGEMETAVSHLQDSVAIFDEIGDEYEWARSRLALARWRQRQGETNAAAAALADCLDVFRRLEASLDAAAARALQETLAI